LEELEWIGSRAEAPKVTAAPVSIQEHSRSYQPME
jgi:hypothetical protein